MKKIKGAIMPADWRNTLVNSIIKQGPWAVMLFIFIGYYYTAHLVPDREGLKAAREENSILIRTITANSSRVARSTEVVAESIKEQKQITEEIKACVMRMDGLLHTFSREVRDTHPEQTRKLDQIIDMVED